MSGLTFQMQSGVVKETINVEGQEISVRDLREQAVNFIKKAVRHFLPYLYKWLGFKLTK